jgi:hypothetical protein
MPASGKTRLARASGDERTYDDYAAGLYQQALLTLGDAGLAEQVVCDVLVGECVRPGPPADDSGDARSRLAMSAYWRCQDLAAAAERTDQPAQQPLPDGGAGGAGCAGLRGLSVQERGALGLVTFGGLGYVQAGRELSISALSMATMLRAALRRMTAAEARLTAG